MTSEILLHGDLANVLREMHDEYSLYADWAGPPWKKRFLAAYRAAVIRATDSYFYAGKAFERQQQRDALGDDEHGRKSW